MRLEEPVFRPEKPEEAQVSKEMLPVEEYVQSLTRCAMWAALFFTDENDRPLLLRAVNQTNVWQFPGGGAEEGEVPFEAAVRETKEETGISFEGEPRLLAVRFQVAHPKWPINMLGVFFDGGRLSPAQLDEIVLDPEEHTEFAVRSLEEWQQTLSARRHEQLGQLLSARNGGGAAYLIG